MTYQDACERAYWNGYNQGKNGDMEKQIIDGSSYVCRTGGKWERIGKWIDYGTRYDCDVCGQGSEEKTPYCPWCGSMMENF